MPTLELAHATHLPLFLHNRATEGEFAAMCTAERSQMGAGGVVHSFDGDVAELKELLGLGLNGCSQDLDVAARARAAGQAASGDQRAVVWDQEKACRGEEEEMAALRNGQRPLRAIPY